MLAALLNTPKTKQEWDTWSFNHRLSHEQIVQAIQTQADIDLTIYQLDPINLQDMPDFLQRNSQMHLDMNTVLGLQSSDLLDVNLADERQRESWIYLHFYEHYDAENALGIAS